MSDECQQGAISRETSPFSNETSPFSKKGSLFSRKTSPYSKQIICPFLLQENGWTILTEGGEKIRLDV